MISCKQPCVYTGMKGKFCTIVTLSDISNGRTTEDMKLILVQVRFELMMILKKTKTNHNV